MLERNTIMQYMTNVSKTKIAKIIGLALVLAGIVSFVPSTNAQTTCTPIPPNGQPLLNIWPISESGNPCTDYPLLAVRNVTQNSGYSSNASGNVGDTIRVRLFVHNGTVDLPQNEAFNVMLKANVPSTQDSAILTAQAWADNAALITSATKGGNAVVNMSGNSSLSYISGSGILYDYGPSNARSLSDNIVTTGASVGNMRGCTQFSHQMTFELKINASQTSGSLSLTKNVRNVTQNQTFFTNSSGANPGDQVEFQMQVSGSGTVSNVNFSDTLPSRLNYVNNSLTVDGVQTGSNLNNLNLGNFSANQTKTVVLRANVSDSSQFSSGATTLTNTAFVSSSSNSANALASVIVNQTSVIGNASLSLTKEVRNLSTGVYFSNSVNASNNDLLQFRLTVRNNSFSTYVNNVRLTDYLPSGLSYVANTFVDDAGASSGNLFSGTQDLGNLFPSQSRTLTFDARVNSTTNQYLTNSASASADNASTVNATATVYLSQVLGTNVNVSLSKRAYNQTRNVDATQVTAQSGDIIVYTLSVYNSGNAPSYNFVIQDDLSDVLQLSQLDAFGNAAFNLGSLSLSWPAETIPAGGRVEKTFSVKVNSSLPAGSDNVMTNIYGNTINVNVNRPIIAGVYYPPKTGTTLNLSLLLACLAVVSFFIYRNRKKLLGIIGF